MSQPHEPAIKAYWQAFLRTLPGDYDAAPTTYQTWGFGNSPGMADDLGRLVLKGIKTATASLA